MPAKPNPRDAPRYPGWTPALQPAPPAIWKRKPPPAFDTRPLTLNEHRKYVLAMNALIERESRRGKSKE